MTFQFESFFEVCTVQSLRYLKVVDRPLPKTKFDFFLPPGGEV